MRKVATLAVLGFSFTAAANETDVSNNKVLECMSKTSIYAQTNWAGTEFNMDTHSNGSKIEIHPLPSGLKEGKKYYYPIKVFSPNQIRFTTQENEKFILNHVESENPCELELFLNGYKLDIAVRLKMKN